MTEHVPEGSLEQLVPEQDFVGLIAWAAGDLLRITNTLLEGGRERWGKRHFFQLHTEADELESFLDDYGARYNQTYSALTELVASVRGLALAGLSLEHLARRLEGYAVLDSYPAKRAERARADLARARVFTQSTLASLLRGVREEVSALGLPQVAESYPQGDFEEQVVRFRLPRNVGLEAIEDEEQRIAEVASKYLQACTMLEEGCFEPSASAERRDEILSQSCTEELARVYEATVHNLQSTYDTYIKNTVLEGQDERLPLLRGHLSASLHLLEAVTQLTHFLERHESDVRDDAAHRRVADIVPRATVSEISLNVLLYWADQFLQGGRALAEDLLPAYTNLQKLELELTEGIILHARPASLIVTIVNHYGTPVEMEVEGKPCNAGSILELMVAVGSHPEARHFAFSGDEHPLRDIGLLFEHGLGERGLEHLPHELSYLRTR